MMLALGFFVFSLHTLAYQEFQRQLAWRHPGASPVGHRPTSQYTGPGEETITLNGVLHAGLAGTRISLDILQAMADEGTAWPLIEGTGRIYGLYHVTSLSHTGTVFFADGAPRKIDFALTLKRAPDDTTVLGGLDTALLGGIGGAAVGAAVRNLL